MPRKPSLKPTKVTWACKSQWKVEIPNAISPTGRRERYFFSTKAAADVFARENREKLSAYGARGSTILSPSAQEQAERAMETIKPFGISLGRVVHEWLNQRQTEQKSLPFKEAMDAFIANSKRSPSYLATLRQTRNRLQRLHCQLMCNITPNDLSESLVKMTESVRNLTIRILGGVFMFAQKRGYCTQNPAKAIGTTSVPQGEIEVYTPEEAELILRTAELHDTEVLPFLLVSLFLGIRRSETLRLDWSAIQLEDRFCRLAAGITKKRRSRHIQIPDNCLSWFDCLKGNGGKVVPFSGNVLRKRLEALQLLHRVETIKHGFRHSFATYSLAAHGDINRLTLELGHNNPSVTFKHYAKVTVKREAEKFFKIHPHGTGFSQV